MCHGTIGFDLIEIQSHLIEIPDPYRMLMGSCSGIGTYTMVTNKPNEFEK